MDIRKRGIAWILSAVMILSAAACAQTEPAATGTSGTEAEADLIAELGLNKEEKKATETRRRMLL